MCVLDSCRSLMFCLPMLDCHLQQTLSLAFLTALLTFTDTVTRCQWCTLSFWLSCWHCVTLSDSDTVTECDTDDNGVWHWVCHCSATLSVSLSVTVSHSLSLSVSLFIDTCVTLSDCDTVIECDTDDNGVRHWVCHCSVTVCQLRCFAWRHYTRDAKLEIYSELIIDSS